MQSRCRPIVRARDARRDRGALPPARHPSPRCLMPTLDNLCSSHVRSWMQNRVAVQHGFEESMCAGLITLFEALLRPHATPFHGAPAIARPRQRAKRAMSFTPMPSTLHPPPPAIPREREGVCARESGRAGEAGRGRSSPKPVNPRARVIWGARCEWGWGWGSGERERHPREHNQQRHQPVKAYVRRAPPTRHNSLPDEVAHVPHLGLHGA